jgi:hypothetical protein
MLELNEGSLAIVQAIIVEKETHSAIPAELTRTSILPNWPTVSVTAFWTEIWSRTSTCLKTMGTSNFWDNSAMASSPWSFRTSKMTNAETRTSQRASAMWRPSPLAPLWTLLATDNYGGDQTANIPGNNGNLSIKAKLVQGRR